MNTIYRLNLNELDENFIQGTWRGKIGKLEMRRPSDPPSVI